MKGLTFDSFINHPTNQNALDMCLKLAQFDEDRKRPFVLLGESGAGKSHLLWSLVNHYRQNRVPVGIALISATDFPSKVKDLAVVPNKLTGNTPVVLLVDDLQRFEKDVDDLEKVIFAVHEHGHTVVLATQIHPNVLPMLSGKLKALLNSGAIVGMKPLPKSENSTIPEAALQQISQLKKRLSELESGAGGAAGTAPTVKAEADTDAPLRQQLELLQRERDEALAALNESKDALGELREQLAAAADSDVSPSEADGLQDSIGALLDRLENQKGLYEERLGALEAEAEQLLALAESLHQGDADPGARPVLESDAPDGLAEARRIIAMQNEDMAKLRAMSQQYAEALERQESEVTTVISGIRDTVSLLARSAAEESPETDVEASTLDSRKALDAIAEQLQVLEEKIPDSPERETEQTSLFTPDDADETSLPPLKDIDDGENLS